jgi:hypothetical protein
MKKSPPPKPRRIVRIRLGATASQALDAVGLPAFAVCGCERSQDGSQQWILYLSEPRHPAALEAAIAIMRNAAQLENQTNESES